MTKPPSGGSASAPSTTEFGATTISGTAGTDRQPSAEREPGSDHNPSTARIHDAGERDAQGSSGSASSGSATRGGLHAAVSSAPPRTPAQTEVAPTQGARAGARGRGPRRARLQVRHVDPMTVLKFSCVLAIALFFVWLIVIGVLYGVLDASGVIDRINQTVTTINGAGSKAPITAGIVFGGAAIVGVANIVLFIALTTIGAVIYNLCADLVGGIEITLSER